MNNQDATTALSLPPVDHVGESIQVDSFRTIPAGPPAESLGSRGDFRAIKDMSMPSEAVGLTSIPCSGPIASTAAGQVSVPKLSHVPGSVRNFRSAAKPRQSMRVGAGFNQASRAPYRTVPLSCHVDTVCPASAPITTTTAAVVADVLDSCPELVDSPRDSQSDADAPYRYQATHKSRKFCSGDSVTLWRGQSIVYCLPDDVTTTKTAISKAYPGIPFETKGVVGIHKHIITSFPRNFLRRLLSNMQVYELWGSYPRFQWTNCVRAKVSDIMNQSVVGPVGNVCSCPLGDCAHLNMYKTIALIDALYYFKSRDYSMLCRELNLDQVVYWGAHVFPAGHNLDLDLNGEFDVKIRDDHVVMTAHCSSQGLCAAQAERFEHPNIVLPSNGVLYFDNNYALVVQVDLVLGYYHIGRIRKVTRTAIDNLVDQPTIDSSVEDLAADVCGSMTRSRVSHFDTYSTAAVYSRLSDSVDGLTKIRLQQLEVPVIAAATSRYERLKRDVAHFGTWLREFDLFSDAFQQRVNDAQLAVAHWLSVNYLNLTLGLVALVLLFIYYNSGSQVDDEVAVLRRRLAALEEQAAAREPEISPLASVFSLLSACWATGLMSGVWRLVRWLFFVMFGTLIWAGEFAGLMAVVQTNAFFCDVLFIPIIEEVFKHFGGLYLGGLLCLEMYVNGFIRKAVFRQLILICCFHLATACLPLSVAIVVHVIYNYSMFGNLHKGVVSLNGSFLRCVSEITRVDPGMRSENMSPLSTTTLCSETISAPRPTSLASDPQLECIVPLTVCTCTGAAATTFKPGWKPGSGGRCPWLIMRLPDDSLILCDGSSLDGSQNQRPVSGSATLSIFRDAPPVLSVDSKPSGSMTSSALSPAHPTL
jgi:hypothetical protein